MSLVDAQEAAGSDLRAAALDFLARRRLVVLTGAGLSTDSGIPDYRGPIEEGLPPRGTPMTYAEFVGAPDARQRYWARSHLGWTRMRTATPNLGHHALARLDPALVITQNVDGLHEAAGTRRLVTLHGRIAQVVCLDCRRLSSRAALQDRMTAANPGFARRWAELTAASSTATRPDGDVALEDTDGFVVPDCVTCGGVLKPHVVFFGENVPAARVQRCYDVLDTLEAADAALVAVGTSLTVMSGLRFVCAVRPRVCPSSSSTAVRPEADDVAAHRCTPAVRSSSLNSRREAGGAQSSTRRTKMCSAASGNNSADSPPDPTSTLVGGPHRDGASGSAPTRRSAPPSAPRPSASPQRCGARARATTQGRRRSAATRRRP